MAKFLQNKELSTSVIIISAAILLVVGVLIGWLISSKKADKMSNLAPVDVRVDSSDYKFINPLLFSRTSKELYSEEYKNLNTALTDQVDKAKKDGSAKDVSIYFRDLNTGHWTGVNETDKYDPSSLLKVVTLMTYLKKSLADPALLSRQLYYPGVDENGQYYKEIEKLPPGNHTILELLRAMIVESDNSAKNVLTKNDIKGFDETYKDFRLPLPATTTDNNDYMSARSYSVILRALYNSTYLPWNISEQTLLLLSLTHFDKGIVAGIPEGIAVAHKFGEHTYLYTDGSIQSRELHDCGIVYYPNKPYLLCVMTRGSDFPALEKVISGISETVYDYMREK